MFDKLLWYGQTACTPPSTLSALPMVHLPKVSLLFTHAPSTRNLLSTYALTEKQCCLDYLLLLELRMLHL